MAGLNGGGDGSRFGRVQGLDPEDSSVTSSVHTRLTVLR